MKHKIIKKKDIAGFINSLIGEYRVFAPVQKGRQAFFREIGSGSEVFLDYQNTTNSPKEAFFPQSERLFAYGLDKKGLKLTVPSEEKKRVVFGIRPCDARSFSMLDPVFDGEKYKDVYYLNKRAATIVIGLGCNKPPATCFCTSVAGNPFSTDGLDLLLVDIGEEYAAEAITDKGERFMEGREGFGEASPDNMVSMGKVKESAEASMSPSVKIDGLSEKLPGLFDHPIWDSLHEKCLGCGICTYLCPTCHCFDIIDEAAESTGERVRIWDSCQFKLFTQETSGANPRPAAKDRLKQRIMHKFSYFRDNYDQTACVGCGRCILHCPVNLDIRRILAGINSI
ncbi:MAG: 4Fe-4S dicluster domain-containing protein [Dehalococcoidia bacterium]